LDLIYPRLCYGCQSHLSETEYILCVYCKSSLPIIEYDKLYDSFISKFIDINPKYIFCFLLYNKGNITQKLLYSFKYNGDVEVGEFLGRWFAGNILSKRVINDIDLIVPVPLHKNKKRERGFNQSEILARTLGSELNIQFKDPLIRVDKTRTQTKKSKTERIFNVKDIFDVNDKASIKNKHILLLDDVITTGSTISSCALILLKNGAERVSVASLAMAR